MIYNIDNGIETLIEDENGSVYVDMDNSGKTYHNCRSVMVFGYDRAKNIDSAIRFLKQDQNAVSVNTICGLTVSRGK